MGQLATFGGRADGQYPGPGKKLVWCGTAKQAAGAIKEESDRVLRAAKLVGEGKAEKRPKARSKMHRRREGRVEEVTLCGSALAGIDTWLGRLRYLLSIHRKERP